MENLLREAGFEVLRSEVEYRSTRLEAEGGLEGWVRLMGAGFLERVNGEEGMERVVREVVSVLRDGGVVGRAGEGDEGGEWLGYVRLRVEAKRV